MDGKDSSGEMLAGGTANFFDLMLLHQQAQRWHIVDLTTPFETGVCIIPCLLLVKASG